jgi:hypothetical protein
MKKKFNRGLLTALLVSAAFAAFPAISHATHSWGGYHWARTSNPFTLKLGNNLTNTWWSYLNTTSTDWTVSTVLDTTTVPGNTASNVRKCNPTSGRVEVCNTTYGNNGWLGVASIWISGSHITQGTVKLNDTYFNTATYNTTAWRNLVTCQEVGHTFGLDHQDTTFNNTNLGTCMDYTNNPYGPPDNEHPNAHDYDELVTIYTHLDSTTTVSQTVQSAPGKGKVPFVANDEPELLGTGQWGKLVRSTNNGRTELFELDLGGGHKVLTHVIWADPEDQPAPVRGRK